MHVCTLVSLNLVMRRRPTCVVCLSSTSWRHIVNLQRCSVYSSNYFCQSTERKSRTAVTSPLPDPDLSSSRKTLPQSFPRRFIIYIYVSNIRPFITPEIALYLWKVITRNHRGRRIASFVVPEADYPSVSVLTTRNLPPISLVPIEP